MKIDYPKISDLYLKATNRVAGDLSQSFYSKVLDKSGNYDRFPWHKAFIDVIREETGLSINDVAPFVNKLPKR